MVRKRGQDYINVDSLDAIGPTGAAISVDNLCCSSTIAKIYGYQSSLDYHGIQTVFMDAYMDAPQIDRPMGLKRIQYTSSRGPTGGEPVTVIFFPRPTTTWMQWYDAAVTAHQFWTSVALEHQKGFSFQFLLLEVAGEDEIGYGVVERAVLKKTEQ
ncbi:MAG: hypothetical protein Q9191_005131 [Dirinaria sp. TL-2023a]